MSLGAGLRVFHLICLSRPASDRVIYRAIRRQPIRSILEVGVGTGRRAVRIIELASQAVPVRQVRYTGIDPFEARSHADGPGLSLKAAYRRLRAVGAQVRLLPGDPWVVLPEAANTLASTDLLVFSADVGPVPGHLWFFVPRMLHPKSIVFAQLDGGRGAGLLRQVSVAEVHDLADRASRRRAA